jgi:hypothetical protein
MKKIFIFVGVILFLGSQKGKNSSLFSEPSDSKQKEIKVLINQGTQISLKDYKINIKEVVYENRDYIDLLFEISSLKEDSLKFTITDNKGNTIMETEPFPVKKNKTTSVRFGMKKSLIKEKIESGSQKFFLNIYERKKLIYKTILIEKNKED